MLKRRTEGVVRPGGAVVDFFMNRSYRRQSASVSQQASVMLIHTPQVL